MTQTVAGIVIYKPDYTALANLVEAIASEVKAIIIVANSPLSPNEHGRLQQRAGNTSLLFDNPGENIGLGGAYERIMAHAYTWNSTGDDIKHVILFDQDSSPDKGMVSALAARMDMLKRIGERPAVIGPKPVAATLEHKPPTIHLHPTHRSVANSRAVWFAISSGSLIDIAACRQIGAFRSDFFIDAIDIEWCLRAWSAGFSCWCAEDVPMPHRLGEGHIVVPLLGWKLPIQSALRLGTYARNQAALLRMNHVPKDWKIRICGYLAVQTIAYWMADYGQIARPRSMITGFAAGIAGRLGPPPDIIQTRKLRNTSTARAKQAIRG